MTMYKATISDGRTVTVFGETFRQANREIDEYIKYHYGFRSHEMDYELEKVVEKTRKNQLSFKSLLEKVKFRKEMMEICIECEDIGFESGEMLIGWLFHSPFVELKEYWESEKGKICGNHKESKEEKKHDFEWLEESIDFENTNESEQGLINTTSEILDLLIEKNEKYGDENLTQHGHSGIMVRLSDKLSRLESLKDSEHTEALEDVYKDIAGYAINGLRLMREGRI